jgi:serine/threonine protein kinase
VTALSDAAVQRLRAPGAWPEFVTDRYTPLEEIGRGGMGTVYLAADRELGREVAVKVPHLPASSTLERRLRIEAHVLARLEHPGIVPIHDVGRLADGRLFYVMKRVRGRTLREHLHELPELTGRLRVFERVCEPVAFAHAQNCIHRDLKPENVMIGAFGEVMVMDWGVARLSDVDVEEGVVGTPGFMSPEQARATGEIDQRADVYSLGAILYMLLTGDDPAGHADPVAAIRRRRDVPRALRSICARALAPVPDGRYDTVAGLADDVARYRAGYAVAAHKENVGEAAVRLARTYRVAILLVLAYVIMRALVAFTVGR